MRSQQIEVCITMVNNQAIWKTDREIEAELQHSSVASCALPQQNRSKSFNHNTSAKVNSMDRQVTFLMQLVQDLQVEIALLRDVVEKSKLFEQVESDLKFQEFRVIPDEQATVQIEEYITKHEGARTSDIICDLGLDPDLVLRILCILQEEKRVRGKDIE